jgi:hypothetical protein
MINIIDLLNKRKPKYPPAPKLTRHESWMNDESYIQALERDNQALADTLYGNAREVILKELHFEGGSLDMYMKHPVFALFNASIAEMFMDLNAENFLETPFQCNSQDFLITIQKRTGKSPSERIGELKYEIERLSTRNITMELLLKKSKLAIAFALSQSNEDSDRFDQEKYDRAFDGLVDIMNEIGDMLKGGGE